MGGGTFSASDYSTRSATLASKSRHEVFQKRSINKDFDPKFISLRESCDSDDSPESTAIIIGLDVTGSMGFIAEEINKNKLGPLVEGILERKPVTNPHIMCMAIGDITCDDAPLQVTQFEADNRMADQLSDLWLEGGGGGNNYESYDLPWIFAATKTKIDCFEKRGKKGYLFTMGDELPPRTAGRQLLNETLGTGAQSDLAVEDYLEMAQKQYHVFHIIVEEGSFCKYGRKERAFEAWDELLGKRAIKMNNYQYVAEIIQSVMEVNEGANPEDVISQWQDKNAREAVEYSLYGPSGQ